MCCVSASRRARADRRPRGRFIAALIVLFAGLDAAGSAAAKNPTISAIHFHGNTVLSSDSLLARMESAERGFLSSPKLDLFILARDLGNVATYYEDSGFLEASVRQGEMDYSADSSRVTIHVDIREGPRWMIRAVTIAGNVRAPEERLRREIAFGPGRPFSPLRVLDGEDRIVNHYVENSFLDADVTSRVERNDERHTVDVFYDIHEGGQARIRDITLSGLGRTDAHVVRRELTLRAGEILRIEDVAKSQAQLYATGLFRSVYIAPDSSSAGDSLKLVVVNLIERQNGEASAGFGYSTVDRLRLQVEARHRNLWGRSLEAGVEASVSNRRRAVSVALGQPWLFGTRFRTNETAGYEHIDTEAFTSEGIRAGVGITRPLGRWWRLDGNYDRSRTVILKAPEGAPRGATSTSKLTFTATYESRDNLLDSHRGFLGKAWTELTGPFLGGTTRFIRHNLDTRLFLPFGSSVLGWRVLAGLTRSQVSGVEIPVNERFFAGGQGSVRGFATDFVGPIDDNGKPTGGLERVVTSVEWRSPYLWLFGVAAFVDAGTTANRPPGIELSDFSVGGGLGLRAQSPIGVLRLDVAGPVTKDRGRGAQVTFGTGQEF